MKEAVERAGVAFAIAERTEAERDLLPGGDVAANLCSSLSTLPISRRHRAE